jgi:hypothetical protein
METRTEYDKEYYLKNKEKKSEQAKKHYLDNKEDIKQKRKNEYLNNKTVIIERVNEYYSNNKEKILKYKKEYRYQNDEKIKEYRLNHKEYYNDYNKEYYLNNKEEISENKKEYYSNNKEKIIESGVKYKKNKYETDSLYKLAQNIRNLIRESLRKEGFSKKSKTYEILGCTFEEFRLYLKSKFEPWMNWSNRGNWNGSPKEINVAWDIDHIIPMSTAKTEEEIVKLNHYTNLQPLCSYTNRHIKSNHIDFKI